MWPLRLGWRGSDFTQGVDGEIKGPSIKHGSATDAAWSCQQLPFGIMLVGATYCLFKGLIDELRPVSSKPKTA